MDPYDKEMKNGFEEMQGSSNSIGNAIPKCELPDEVMSILSSPCTNDECLDIRLEIHHQQNKLEEKLEEVRQLESCILKLTTKMAQINCECNQQHNSGNAFEADRDIIDSSLLQETVGPTISVDGLDYPTSLLVNATCTIQKALVSTVSSVVNPVPAIPIVLGENNEKASSPSNTDADEIDSGIQVDYEEKEPGIINFINAPLVENPPADESGKEQEQEDPKAEIPEYPPIDEAPAIDETPQIDENIRKQLIENARQQNRQRMETKRDLWSEQERALFKNGLKIHGKNFGEIAKSIGTKNVLECVEYYYDTKLIVKYKIGGNIPKGKSGVTLTIRKPEEKKRKRTESVESNDGEQKKKEQAAGKNGQQQKKQKKDKEEEEKYEVDYIFGKREKRNGKPGYEYRVFWKGYTRADSTWEPEENLKDCAKAIKRFNKQQCEVLDDKTNAKK